MWRFSCVFAKYKHVPWFCYFWFTLNIGGKKGHKKFHKKGSKATGYHKKANKDDYHKEHEFYDSEDKKGDHKKYGSEHEYHEAEKGEHGKGDKHESGYDEGHKGDNFCDRNACILAWSLDLIGWFGHSDRQKGPS